ncbi:MAG: hypothetical protein HLUCCA11_20575 [Phormidesmis priestleyi Ana]|uniref:Uncharacterized protein n=1 Tax=Phormidesmis priestleyi Ana TaxID=1666911 RepID=A0A0P7ZDQ5_9CYAN|nr:MAG: hypothetical protein HLUCCA11_20575 [Phormidesmis priestleyi Ana]
MSQSISRTNTPQEYFAHVGSLESQEAIALIAYQMLNHEQCGLKQVCLDGEEETLLQAFETLLSDYECTSREQWARLKESCLLLLGSPIASCVDHLISGLRTPAIAESAIRSAGLALIAANQKKAELSSQGFMRSLLAQAIYR